MEMSCTKFHENLLILDGEIDEKHALLVSCGLMYSYSTQQLWDYDLIK